MLSILTFRTPDEAVEKANNTPYGLSAGVWTDKGSRILWMADRLRAGVVWANTFNKFDPASPVRRLPRVRVRPRGRPPRAAPAYLKGAEVDEPARRHARPTSCTSGGSSPAPSRGGPTRRSTARVRPLGAAAGASRKDLRDAVRAAREAGPGWAERPPTTGVRSCTGSPRCSRTGASTFVDQVARSEGLTRRAAAERWAGDRPLGLVRRVGRQVRPDLRQPATRWPGPSSTSRPRSRPGWSGWWPRRCRRCSGWSRGWPR